MTNEEKARVLALRESGLGYKAISNETGISHTTIAYFLKTVKEAADICRQCGARLDHTPHRKRKKFCSDKCRMLWWNSHPDEVNRAAYYTAVCRCCGKEFMAYGNDHRTFCSRTCYQKFRSGKR